jgi:hypothetical protein
MLARCTAVVEQTGYESKWELRFNINPLGILCVETELGTHFGHPLHFLTTFKNCNTHLGIA